MDVVDALYSAARNAGARIMTDAEVTGVRMEEEFGNHIFAVETADGQSFSSGRLIIATGGLSYPNTGSTGDGYKFAKSLGHSIKQCFPSLTALVPKEYKLQLEENSPELKGHVDRSSALSETGTALCGNSLKT